jgi:hypothetical protein
LKDFLRHCDRKGYTAGERALLIALWIHTPNDVNGASCYPRSGALRLAGLSERQVTRALVVGRRGRVVDRTSGRDRGRLMVAFSFAGKKRSRRERHS